MKAIRVVKKGNKVTSPEGEVFQMVYFEITLYGCVMELEYDTKIENGVQTVNGGDGFIPHGFVVED